MDKDIKNNSPLAALEKIQKTEEQAQKDIQDAHESTSQMIIEEAQKEAEKIKEKIITDAKKRLWESWIL